FHASAGYASTHASSPRVSTTPPAIAARNLAGSVSRFFSSTVCSCSPRSIGPRSPTLLHKPPQHKPSAPLSGPRRCGASTTGSGRNAAAGRGLADLLDHGCLRKARRSLGRQRQDEIVDQPHRLEVRRLGSVVVAEGI